MDIGNDINWAFGHNLKILCGILNAIIRLINYTQISEPVTYEVQCRIRIKIMDTGCKPIFRPFQAEIPAKD